MSLFENENLAIFAGNSLKKTHVPLPYPHLILLIGNAIKNGKEYLEFNSKFPNFSIFISLNQS